MTRNRPRHTQHEAIVKQAAKLSPKKRTVAKKDTSGHTEETVSVTLRTNPIMLGVPMDEVMFSKFFAGIIRAEIMPWDSIVTTESTYLPDARNLVHDAFLKSGLPHLFMVDSDVLIMPWIIQTLLGHKKDLVGGWYHQKGAKVVDGQMVHKPTVYKRWEVQEDGFPYFEIYDSPEKGLMKVAGIGAGCIMMNRKLAEALGESPYHTDKGVGEDLVMCKKVLDLGYDIWVDWELACPHVGVSYV